MKALLPRKEGAMKPAALLVVLLFVASNLCAQQQPQEPPKPAPAATPAEAVPPNAAQTPAPPAAPQLGHPLDPKDVDVLTGKADRDARANAPRATPYIGYGQTGYGYGGLQFGGSTATSPPFVPLVFGSFGGRPFAVFGNTSPAASLLRGFSGIGRPVFRMP